MTTKGLLLVAISGVTLAGIGVTAAAIVGHSSASTKVLGTSVKADYALNASPQTQAIQSGDVASYTVSVSPLNDFSGTVQLSAARVPIGATVCWTSSCASTASITTNGSVTLLVKNAPVSGKNDFTITVNGAAGSIKHSVDVSLTVNKPATYSLALAPTSVTVDPGSTGTYAVNIDRSGGFNGPVSLAVSGLPKGSAGTLSSAVVGSSDANPTLSVQTDPKTSAGSFTVTVTGTATGQPTQTAQATLQVSSAKWIPFTISGSVVNLVPGDTPTAIDLTLSNPNKTAISVTNLSVSVPASDQSATCGSGNFGVSQYSGPLPLAIPAGGTIHLSDASLSIDQKYWPTVQFLDDPVHPQDACLGTPVTLNYAGTATGA